MGKYVYSYVETLPAFTQFKVNDTNTKTKCKMCSKLTIKTPERGHKHRSGIFSVNFNSDEALCSIVFTVNFEQL